MQFTVLEGRVYIINLITKKFNQRSLFLGIFNLDLKYLFSDNSYMTMNFSAKQKTIILLFMTKWIGL